MTLLPCRDMVLKLLEKKPHKRLGSVHHSYESDPDSVKRHPFFASVNWAELTTRSTKAPFIPGEIAIIPR